MPSERSEQRFTAAGRDADKATSSAQDSLRDAEDAVADLESGGFDARIVIAPVALLALLAVLAGLFMFSRTRSR